jgi:DNA-binding response OmpR family regulator
MNVVLLTSDLMVSSRIEGAAIRSGVDLRAAPDAQAALQACLERSPDKLIIDLATRPLDVVQLIDTVKREVDSAPLIIAFGPHVHEQLLASARQAGCDHVVSRGQFFGQLDVILGDASE